MPDFEGGFANNGILFRQSSVRLADVTDGTSTTLMVGEIAWDVERAGFRLHHCSWIRGTGTGPLNRDGVYSCSCKNVHFGINEHGWETAVTSPGVNGGDYRNDVSFGSHHPGGCQFAMGDASVQFLSEDIDLAAYKSLASRNGGEVVGEY